MELPFKTFFNEPKTFAQATYVERIICRGVTLLKDGYRIQQFGKCPCYAIFKPENEDTRNGFRDYCVDLTPGKVECNCEAFRDLGDCKHRIAAQLFRLAQQGAQEQPHRLDIAA